MRYTAETMLIKSNDTGGTGIIAEVLAPQAGWEFLNMQVRRMNRGERWAHTTGEHEYVHVILGGICHIRTSAGDFLNVGRRPNVFSGMPYAVYLSRRTEFVIEALTDGFEVATCWVPTGEDHPAQLVTPADSEIELRGGANASRQIVHREDEQGNLLEADLEEIYFYKLDRPGGYAYQRVYNDDRSIDAVMMAEHHDAVLVPEGYHPVVSAHGYTTYYLNFLAGSAQSLANTDDPDYAWIKNNWTFLDPRLPIVDHGMEPRRK